MPAKNNLSLMLPADIRPLWKQLIIRQSEQEYFSDLVKVIATKRSQGIEIYPEDKDVFSAMQYLDLNEIKVVILGQDPYHGPNQAHGLAFSVNSTMKMPPSLKNIFKELTADIEGFISPLEGDLTQWAKQGVLLLNTVLTVERGKAHSHAKLGWEQFTDQVIAQINQSSPHCVFMLWGMHAQNKGKDIDPTKHLILKSVHPSPLSAYRGFLGCRHFSQANAWLIDKNMAPIDWIIKENRSLDLF